MHGALMKHQCLLLDVAPQRQTGTADDATLFGVGNVERSIGRNHSSARARVVAV